MPLGFSVSLRLLGQSFFGCQFFGGMVNSVSYPVEFHPKKGTGELIWFIRHPSWEKVTTSLMPSKMFVLFKRITPKKNHDIGKHTHYKDLYTQIS